MQPPHHHSRVNLTELKAQIVKKLGPEGSMQYFYYLNRFLGLKLTKVEFNKLCFRILGRENIPLHNQLIRSILRNACSAKTPPLLSQKDDVLEHGTEVGVSADVYLGNGSHTMAPASGSLGLSNGGDVLPLSPRKVRTGIRDRRTRSSLRPNGTSSFAPQLPTAAQSSDFNAVLENGDLIPPNHRSQLQHHQGHAPKTSLLRRSPDVSAPSCSKDLTELAVGDDAKEGSALSPLQAPLGVLLCHPSIGGAHKGKPLSTIGTFSDGALMDSLTLRERMEKIAVIQGLNGVSVECANILNHGLDAYLKGLIRSCIELAGSRSGHVLTKNSPNKNQSHTKLINGVKPGHQYQMQNRGKPSDVQGQSPISLHDFRFSMELNPQKMGEDWPLLLEKICTHAFEE